MCRKKILETLILYRPSANQPFVTLPLCMSTVRHQQQQMMQPLKSPSPLSPCRIPVVWDILAGGRAASCYVLHCACTKLHNAQARAAQLYVARIWWMGWVLKYAAHCMCVETYKHPRRERNRTTYKYTVYLWVCACVFVVFERVRVETQLPPTPTHTRPTPPATSLSRMYTTTAHTIRALNANYSFRSWWWWWWWWP